MSRLAAALLLLGLAAPVLAAAPPASLERLPAGALVVGYVDASAWRASPAVAALDAAPLLDAFGLAGGLLDGLGSKARIDRAAFGGFPRGEGTDVALVVEGAWDEAALQRDLVAKGATEVAVAGRSSWRLPRTSEGNDFVLTPLAAGVLAISDWELAPKLAAGGGGLDPRFRGLVADLPDGLSGWALIADPSAAGRAGGLDRASAEGIVGSLRSFGIWFKAGDTLRAGATARARDAAAAQQLAALVQVSLLGLSMQGETPWSALLPRLRFETKEERIDLELELDASQLGALTTGWAAAAPSLPAGAPPASGR